MFPEPENRKNVETKKKLPELLTSIISRYFGANYFVEDFRILEKELNNSNFSNQANEFKQQLADVINYQSITPKVLNDLTNVDYETQEEVDEFLKTEIWQPLYGDEPITRQQTA